MILAFVSLTNETGCNLNVLGKTDLLILQDLKPLVNDLLRREGAVIKS